MKKQSNTPIYSALKEYHRNNVIPFDVPGHKHGNGNKELAQFLGKRILEHDVNSMKCLDNACHPISVIKEAEELMAEAFGADYAFMLANGTSSGVQAMIMSTCKENDKIIMPRNVHKSAINALILSGAIPVYINPKIDEKLGISLGITAEDVLKAIIENPDAKAVFINNPTYYGICSDMKEIIDIAHKHDIYVLADEAHGTHFYFHNDLPNGAISLGADMAAVSIHKTGGSLTQTSALLINEAKLNRDYVRSVLNLTQTTSTSYLLLSSLDIARKMLFIEGNDMLDKTIKIAEYARKKINALGGYYAYCPKIIDKKHIYNFDITKLSVNTKGIGLSGIEVYDILRDEYNIQLEYGDTCNMLAMVTIGDDYENVDKLIDALASIKEKYSKKPQETIRYEYVTPNVVIAPRKAFYSRKFAVELDKSLGMISGEFVMCYPPGIPILSPGEEITPEVLDNIMYIKEKGGTLTGPEDLEINKINVVGC